MKIHHEVAELQIDKISSSGNAWGESVDLRSGRISLGPVKCQYGDVVNAIVITNKKSSPQKYGICTDRSLWGENYEKKASQMFDQKSGYRPQFVSLLKKIKRGDYIIKDQEERQIFSPQILRPASAIWTRFLI